MAKQALASGSPGNNPITPSAEEITGLYEQAWRTLNHLQMNFFAARWAKRFPPSPVETILSGNQTSEVW